MIYLKKIFFFNLQNLKFELKESDFNKIGGSSNK